METGERPGLEAPAVGIETYAREEKRIGSAAASAWPAEVIGYLEGPEEDPMHLPSHVLALARGKVAVLDGANDRIAFFEADGSFEGYVGSRGANPGQFRLPLGLSHGPGATLIVADTGNARLQILDPNGVFLRSIEVPSRPRLAEPTGVTWDRDGKRLFVTDRINGVIHRVTTRGFTFGKPMVPSPRVGGLNVYPFAPLWAGDRLLWLEPLTGTIRAWIPHEGRFSDRDCWGWGVGALYRPKGIAMDSMGRCVVSDGDQGTLSLFSKQGIFLGLVTDDQGGALLFDMPEGLDFQKDGRLYVVEMTENRVAIVELQSTGAHERLPLLSCITPTETPEPESPGDRACKVCHAERFASFREDGLKDRGRPAPATPAARPDGCLGCHDGSIVDSRPTAFALHGHLDEARARGSCMICHQAHGEPEPRFDMSSAIFLKLPGARGELCLKCHAGYMPRPDRGHVVTGLKKRFPEALVLAGAAPPSGVRSPLTCRSCHVPHGEREKWLLVGEEGPCTACHSMQTHVDSRHTGQGGLYCWECHGIHDGRGNALLPDAPAERERRPCATCHEDKAGVAHNAHGRESEGDSCLRCHALYSENDSKEPLWAFGLGKGADAAERRCTFCHSVGNPFSAKVVTLRAHHEDWLPLDRIDEASGSLMGKDGPLTCVVCHDPHSASRSCLKPGRPQTLCASCHGERSLSLYLGIHLPSGE